MSRVSRTAVSVCTFSEDGRARQTHLSQEKGGGVCRLSTSHDVTLMFL